MRISDWSSDVCSSDLVDLRQLLDRECHIDRADILLEIGDPLGTGDRHDRLVTVQQPSKRQLTSRDAVPCAQRLDFLQQRRVTWQIVTLEDRKSVVSGKSVSVRVDLGGRRIIKKKKQTKHNN